VQSYKSFVKQKNHSHLLQQNMQQKAVLALYVGGEK
jgi:hypothetical protein